MRVDNLHRDSSSFWDLPMFFFKIFIRFRHSCHMYTRKQQWYISHMHTIVCSNARQYEYTSTETSKDESLKNLGRHRDSNPRPLTFWLHIIRHRASIFLAIFRISLIVSISPIPVATVLWKTALKRPPTNNSDQDQHLSRACMPSKSINPRLGL